MESFTSSKSYFYYMHMLHVTNLANHFCPNTKSSSSTLIASQLEPFLQLKPKECYVHYFLQAVHGWKKVGCICPSYLSRHCFPSSNIERSSTLQLLWEWSLGLKSIGEGKKKELPTRTQEQYSIILFLCNALNSPLKTLE